MDLDNSEDNVDITEYFEESYNKEVRTREEELVRSQEEVVGSTSQNVVENTEKVVGRGRPKAASHHNKDIMNVTSQET
ncbi:28603_t:CDS:2, partial [Gigaspora margarita]